MSDDTQPEEPVINAKVFVEMHGKVHFPWRFQTGHEGEFDELVLGNGLHVEMMDKRTIWLAVYRPDGERWSFFLTVDQDGTVTDCTLAEEPGEE